MNRRNIASNYKIITANNLRQGYVMYYHVTHGWQNAYEQASIIAHDDIDNIMMNARYGEDNNEVVGIEVVSVDDNKKAMHKREYIRQHGPTINYVPHYANMLHN